MAHTIDSQGREKGQGQIADHLAASVAKSERNAKLALIISGVAAVAAIISAAAAIAA